MFKIFTVIVISSLSILAQTEFNSFLSYINSLPSENRQAVADSFYYNAKAIGIPFIEGDTNAVFLYRGTVSKVNIAGDFNGWDYGKGACSKIQSTNFFYLKKVFEPDARLDYKIVLNGSDWILDPANPNTVWGGFGPNSELTMPNYIQPWEINYNPSIAHGRKITTALYSALVGKNFSITIYLPPGYDSHLQKRYPAAYFQDGAEYIDLASAVNVIDNLIDSNKIVPLIGVFVKPNNRNEEYAFGLREKYVRFFSEELVPYIDSLYRTVNEPQFRLVLGDSYGGNISALIAFRYPELFGNCGLHSAAFQPNNYEVYNLWVNADRKETKFYSVWGTYEGLYANMRQFKDIMENKGYEFEWREYHEGHSWGLWRATIDLMLEYFFPPTLTSLKESSVHPLKFELMQNYPNPFNPVTIIGYKVAEAARDFASFQMVTLTVFDVLGREVKTVVKERKSPGIYDVVFDGKGLPSGVYIYKLTAGKNSTAKKMILLK